MSSLRALATPRVRFFTAGFAAAALAALMLVSPTHARAAGRQDPSLNFFSGGGEGAHADWLATTDQPPGDTDNQAIRIVTTTDPNGYAGINVQHAPGLPVESYPESSFDVKAVNYSGPSLGSPRLVYLFADGGRAELRPLTLSETWQNVADPNWDNNGGACGFLYETTWKTVQSCHAGVIVTAIYLTTDPYGHEYRIDNLTTAGTTFSHGEDNTNSDPSGLIIL